ncbi:MAG: type 1 glutamine amidotransferase [Chthoniobacteraceae bacterium]
MRIHSLEHAPFEGPGRIAAWAAERGHTLSRTALWEGEMPPALDAFDMLVIMGGPMSIHDHRDHPWLPMEKDFLKTAITARKPILGICLGAQLLADVLGGKVFQNPVKEIGWFPVRMLDRSAPFGAFPERLTVMHWHGDTFTIPEGARGVAESEACANQAFVFGERVVGLQFHIELERVGIEDLAAASLDEVGAAPFIQSREQLISPPPESSAGVAALHALLDELAGFR